VALAVVEAAAEVAVVVGEVLVGVGVSLLQALDSVSAKTVRVRNRTENTLIMCFLMTILHLYFGITPKALNGRTKRKAIDYEIPLCNLN
jgi:flagellar biosynthesis protein FliQ